MLTIHYTYISASCCRFINFSTSQILKVTQMCRCRRELIFSVVLCHLFGECIYVRMFICTYSIIVSFLPVDVVLLQILLGWYVSFCRKRMKKNKNTVSDSSFGSIEICFNLHINHTTAEMKSRYYIQLLSVI